MIVSRITGGLGNQMFQYAAGYALARRLGCELLLDLRSFETYKLHRYGLDQLRITAARATTRQLAAWPSWSLELAQRTSRWGWSWRWYAQPHFGYDDHWSRLRAPRAITGYFQSPLYFQEQYHALQAEFAPVQPLNADNTALAQTIGQVNSVMLHVRRGDYVSDARTYSVHGACDVSYYQRAIRDMEQRVSEPHYFVFSNDLQWARDHLSSTAPMTFVEGNADDPVAEMQLMKACRHHVLANSTFSWWAAWLGASQESVVIAPRQWFASTQLSSRDLIPTHWTQL